MTEEFYFLKQNKDGEFEQYEPYITFSVDTEKDYEFMKQAIEKQIAKKPDTKTVNKGIDISGEYNVDSDYICPSCTAVVGDYETEDHFYDYCPNCGQKLDWSKKDE